MANTYTQLHIQFVFAVKYRKALIDKEWKERLHHYITGIIQSNHHKMLCINSMPDHIQEEHHKKETFLEEYQKILKAFEIEYDEQYIFTEPIE